MSKEKMKWRPNLFDIIVILIGIAAVAILFVVNRPAETAASPSTSKVSYTINLLNLPEGTYEHIQVGDTIIDNVKKLNMGTVTAIEAIPYTVSATDKENGVVYQAPVDGWETILLTLEADAVVTDSSITATSGYVIQVGSSVKALGPTYAGTGYILNIQR